MKVYRLSNSEFAGDLEGTGAKLYGGRWNNKGTACIYTSASRALSVLELAANVETEFLPANLSITSYEFPDSEIRNLSEKELPENWTEIPGPSSTKDLGSKLLLNPNVLCIRVPSIMVEQEYNYLINPESNRINSVHIIEITKFQFDNRIKK